MYHNVHLWTNSFEGQFPRTNRKGAVEESLLWLDFQSLPKALMSIAHVYPLHNVIRMRRQRSSRKACYGWTLIRSLPPLVVVVQIDPTTDRPQHISGHFPSGIKPPGRTNPPRLSSNLLAKRFSSVCKREKYPNNSLFPQFSSGSCHQSKVYMNGQW